MLSLYAPYSASTGKMDKSHAQKTCPFETGAMGRMCLFIIVSLVIVLSIKIELKQIYWSFAPTQKIRNGFL